MSLSFWLTGKPGRELRNILLERKGLKELATLSSGEGSDLSTVTQAFGDKVWAIIHG